MTYVELTSTKHDNALKIGTVDASKFPEITPLTLQFLKEIFQLER